MTTFQPQTLLVAFDLSQKSLRAWRYARALARRVGATVEAVYVSQWNFVPEGPLAFPPLTPPDRLALEKKLKRRLGPGVVARIAEGDTVGEILKTARDRKADLIVMATEGRTGMNRVLLGSITEAVVRLSPIPVLSLRKAARLPRSLLAPVNLQPYSMAGFRFAKAVAKSLGARMTLLHVRSAGAAADPAALIRLQVAAEDARANLPVDVNLKVVDGKPVLEILAESARHDLVVLIAHRRGIFHDGILGTTAEQVLRRSQAPVLCVPAPLPAPAPAPKSRRRASSRRRSVSHASWRRSGGPTRIKM